MVWAVSVSNAEQQRVNEQEQKQKDEWDACQARLNTLESKKT
jgi:hypothetical protein